MERLKEIVKDEIKEIEKIEKIEKIDNITKYKLCMYRVLYIYAVRERREETASGLLSS